MSFVESQLRTQRCFYLGKKEEEVPCLWKMKYKILQRFLPAETHTQTDMNAFGSIRLLKNHSSKRREMQNSLHYASFRQSTHVFKCCSWSSLSIERLQANPQAEGNPQSQQAASTN